MGTTELGDLDSLYDSSTTRLAVRYDTTLSSLMTDDSEGQPPDQQQPQQVDHYHELYQRYVCLLYHYVLRRVGDSREAERITAQVFDTAFGSFDLDMADGTEFSHELYRIAHDLITVWNRQNPQ